MAAPTLDGAPPPGRTRPLTAALPVTVALLVLALLAALVSPTVRHQLDVSFVKQPQRYVQLSFADPATAVTCPVVDGRLDVTAELTSRLGAPAALPYSVTATDSTGRRVSSVAGSAATSPGRTVALDTRVAVATDSGYDVAIVLTGRAEHLELHCANGAGS